MRIFLLSSISVYFFCVALRFYYPFVLESYPQFLYHNAWLLNTNDGYFYAQGAKDILLFLQNFTNDSLQDSLLKSTLNSPIHEPLAIITASIAYLTPFSLEQVLFYLSGFMGTLIVFPTMWLTKAFGILPSILAGLLSALSVSYYNRTIFGYYDTDMLILPLCLGICALILQKNPRYTLGFLFALSVFALLYYPNLRYVFLGFIAILVFFKDKRAALIILMLSIPFALYIPLLPFYIGTPLWILVGLALSFVSIPQKFFWLYLCAFTLFVLYILFPSFLNAPFISTLFNAPLNPKNAESLPFLNVLDSIAETSKISFFALANRVSGNLVLFLLSLLGYCYLVYKQREFLIFLPLLFLGFFALAQGLRFSFYAVPVCALGLSYLFAIFSNKIPLHFILRLAFIALILSPHLMHIKSYTPKPILDSTEANLLYAIPSKNGDFALSWWDYGYMINYFSNLNVFIDGGKHLGKQNYPISLFLSHSDNHFSYKIAKTLLDGTIDKHQNAPNFTESLLSHPIANHTKNLYIILFLDMLEIFPSIVSFSAFDTITHKAIPLKFFSLSQNTKSQKAYFKNNFILDLKRGILSPNHQQIAKLISLKTNQTQHFNPKSPLSALELKDGRIVLCDTSYFESFYFQGLFFETLNPNLFQKVLKNDKITIYKLL